MCSVLLSVLFFYSRQVTLKLSRPQFLQLQIGNSCTQNCADQARQCVEGGSYDICIWEDINDGVLLVLLSMPISTDAGFGEAAEIAT